MFGIELCTGRRNRLENDSGKACRLTGISAGDMAGDAGIARGGSTKDLCRRAKQGYEQCTMDPESHPHLTVLTVSAP